MVTGHVEGGAGRREEEEAGKQGSEEAGELSGFGDRSYMIVKRYKMKLDFVIYVDKNITYNVGENIINNVTKGGNEGGNFSETES